ncbi:MAG: hypothetical protein FJX54_22635 [Alphaproteobacteria bacterium]|nr:hypothetical protein [Alphaproteobacteria bacterium]
MIARLLLAAMLAFVCLAEVRADPMPTEKRRQYEPYSRGTSHTLGTMWLSTTYARFSRLKGRMLLEHAGVWPEDGNFELRGAKIYRVTNPEPYFELNKGKNGFCGEPVRWIGVRKLGGDEVRVTFFTIADYRAYNPNSHGLCSGDSYTLG